MLKLSRNPDRYWKEVIPLDRTRCREPFGNRRVIENMQDKLGAYSMFASERVKRLQMYADSHVLDMMNKNEQIAFEAEL